MAEKKLNIDPLITHRFKIDDAQKAYNLILGKTKEPFLGVLFEYDVTKQQKTKIFISDSPVSRHSDTFITVGFVGAGSFAQMSLLPHIKSKKSKLIAVADTQGHIAKHVASKYDADYCTSDYKQILADKNINTVFIATRHNLHVKLIIDSLKAGKHVYCEKPLCLNKQELAEINNIYNGIMTNDAMTPVLMIGFNRRFAPLTLEAKELLGSKIGPYIINYRINAGMLPEDHWLLDPEQGGGRIIGEVCHFVDLITHFVDADLQSVYAEALSGTRTVGTDNVIATLKYTDGSVGNISYFGIGDKDFPKERIEIFGDNKACVIDDFRVLEYSCKGKTTRLKQAQDKGYKNEISAFYNAILQGGTSPVPFEKIVEATLATFAIDESIRIGKSVTI